MGGELSTIQSLKAVDAWIDVINANINGGVRTAFKSSRLKFAGSNVDVARTGTSTSLPLQFSEPSLTTANTVIDFTQGAITASTENTHLAVQGEGFFLLVDPATVQKTTGLLIANTNARFYLTRDGEFHTDANGLLVHSSGYYVVTNDTGNNVAGQPVIWYDTAVRNGATCWMRAVYNDLDNAISAASPQRAARLSQFVQNACSLDVAGNVLPTSYPAVAIVAGDAQSLMYSTFGSTVFDFGFKVTANCTALPQNQSAQVKVEAQWSRTDTILSKSLEASNASMTQSVPELSLAQKLFSALTKVLQTKQTNVDGVLNLVR
jgi:flagellar hook protein FlgE